MTIPSYPESLEAITPDWLSQALSSRFPGARVSSACIVKRIDGTATKLRYQLEFEDPVDASAAPSSLWIKSGFNTKGANQGEAFVNEVNFFRDLAPILPINAPECYYGSIDQKSRNGILLLEDLINRGASFGHPSHPLSADQTASVLSLQARYHASYWNSPRLGDYPWLKAGGAIADADMVDQFFGLWDSAVPLPRFRHVTRKQRDKMRVKNALKRMVQNLKLEAACLVHGDSGVPNIYFLPDGTPGYLDWQHVMRGCWAFDLAAFIITSLTVADRRAHERALLSHYLGELAAHGADAPTFDEAWRQYRRYAMWPFMWVMLPPSVHPEEVCDLNAERACAAIEDLETIECLEEFY